MTIFINKGDAPMDARQATKRGLRHFEAEKAQWQREQGIVEEDPAYLAWAQGWIDDNKINAANNLFNYQLAQYRGALARLARYRLSVGQAEVVETDEDGNDVVVSPLIEPLPATVEMPAFDPETGAQTGVEQVPNPAIVRDEAERAAAQAIVTATPEAVRAFDGGAA